MTDTKSETNTSLRSESTCGKGGGLLIPAAITESSRRTEWNIYSVPLFLLGGE